METEKKTCKDLVEEKMWERSSQLEDLYDIIDDEEKTTEEKDEAFIELNQLALDISSYRVIKVLLSTGGPADWIEVMVDDEGDIRGMTYHYADWFDHASMTIPKNTYFWDYITQTVDTER